MTLQDSGLSLSHCSTLASPAPSPAGANLLCGIFLKPPGGNAELKEKAFILLLSTFTQLTTEHTPDHGTFKLRNIYGAINA